MANTNHSMSTALAEWLRLQNNAMTIQESFSQAVSSKQENIQVNQELSDGTVVTVDIPTFGSLKSKIKILEEGFSSITSINGDSANVRMPDGTYKQIYESKFIKEPPVLGPLTVPSKFGTKNNWVFESFTNPLLYVTFNASQYLTNDTDNNIILKRIILTLDTTAKLNYFTNSINGRNDLDYAQLVDDLNVNNISYIVDDDIVALPSSILRYSGNFALINFEDTTETQTVGGQTFTTTLRKYKLDKISYNDNLESVTDTQRLRVGDKLIVGENSLYEISTIDETTNIVTLKRLRGKDIPKIGVDIFTIYSERYKSGDIDVNVGFNEYQVIFFKTVDSHFSVASTVWSSGIGFYSNDLLDSTGTQTLAQFYNTNVLDFGKTLLAQATERAIPALFGETPDAPILDATTFTVVVINEHAVDNADANEIKRKQSDRVSLNSEIQQLDISINKKKQEINSTNYNSDAEKTAAKNELDSLIRDKSAKSQLYSTLVTELSNKAKESSNALVKPKHRIRGFVPLPSSKTSGLTQDQEIVQIETWYRYLRKDGNTADLKQYISSDGNTRVKGAFSDWIKTKSDVRERKWDATQGVYVWSDENIEDAESININQIDIPISNGEQVEFKVRAISEAGWPLNPVMSDWSESVIIDFPSNLAVGDESSNIIKTASDEESRVKFQTELNARGLDLHLASSFSSGEKYYPHTANEIASGFFGASGNIITLYEKLKALEDRLISVENVITAAKGTLTVYLVDELGVKTEIKNNSTLNLFAGYYDELLTLSTTTNAGKIITKIWEIEVINSSGSILELYSIFPGPTLTALEDVESYEYTQRQYGFVPINLSGSLSANANSDLKQRYQYQSSQIKSQWLWSRYANIGLGETLYAESTSPIWTADAATGSIANVWNGIAGDFSTPGELYELCIHKDHPDVQSGLSISQIANPTISGSTYSKAIHNEYFYLEFSETNGEKQLEYTPSSASGMAGYNAKIGFLVNDEYLIGRKSCGAYLYVSPLDYSNISVPGSDFLSSVQLEAGSSQSLRVPVVFQFRAVDKLGYIGGWRSSSQPQNVTYTKKIGIDITPRNQNMFSFDIKVTGKFKRDTTVAIPQITIS